MRTKILALGLICFFIFILTSPIFGEGFSLSGKNTRQKSFDEDTVFTLLQYSAWFLIDMDTVFTYRTIWRHGLSAEANPFWRGILDKPALVFAIDMVIKVGIVWGTSKLYKKSKLLAYCFIIGVNIVQIYCISTHT